MADPTFRLRNLAPPDLPAESRRLFYSFVVEIGLKVKDRELARGLDRHGKPLRAVSAKTAKHRRSAMTPDGKGDPSAPALMPARALSRTRSLLAGRATDDAAIFYWRFDPFSGQGWGRILAIHRRKGRDVIGLSPEGTARVRALAWERWRKYQRGEYVPATTAATAGPGIPQVGNYSTKFATFGIGAAAPPKFAEGKGTGGMTWPEWRRYLTQPNPTPVAIPGRPAGAYNRLLAHVWGTQGPPGPGKPPAKPKAPRPDPSMFNLPVRNPIGPTPGEPLPDYHPTDEAIDAAFAKAAKAKAAAKKAAATLKAKKAAAAAFPADPADLPVVRTLGGSTGAKLVKDPATGREFVLKKGANPGHLREEAHADALYRAMGLDVPESRIYDTAAGPVKLAEFHAGVTLGELKRTDPAAYAKAREEVRKGFVADALLGNWDVIGMGADNILVTPAGKVLRIDNGGSLRYRAQGAQKSPSQWTGTVGELDTLRNPSMNSAAAEVFGGITAGEIKAQAKALLRKRAAIVKAAPDELKGVLGRRLDFLKDYGKAPKTPKKIGDWKPAPADSFQDVSPDLKAWGERHYRAWMDSLSREERDAISSYTGSGYRRLNEYLRGQTTSPPGNASIVPFLDKALNARPVPEDIVVYRGMDMDAVYRKMGIRGREDLRPGMDVEDKGYTSTSPAFGGAWAGEKLEIRVKKGLPGAWVDPISSTKGELEFILGRDVDTLRVVEVRRDRIVVEALRSEDLAKGKRKRK
jgi:hypothetical protein